jgi:hypothetical protein
MLFELFTAVTEMRASGRDEQRDTGVILANFHPRVLAMTPNRAFGECITDPRNHIWSVLACLVIALARSYQKTIGNDSSY